MSKRILAVEDQEDNMQILRDLLTSTGYEVIEAVNGEKDLFGDASVVLVHLPGHTPGSIGALVNLDRDGPFLLASDSVSLRQHLDTDTAPRNTWNAEAQSKTYAEVRRIEKSGATIICGHDDQQWQRLRKGTEGYE